MIKNLATMVAGLLCLVLPALAFAQTSNATLGGTVTDSSKALIPGVTITATSKTGTTVTVFFTTLNGSNHVLEYKNSLKDTGWIAILPGVIGNGSVLSKTDTNATAASRFYRIHVE